MYDSRPLNQPSQSCASVKMAPRVHLLNARDHFECIHGALGAPREGTAFLWNRPLAHGAWKKIKPNSPVERGFGLLKELQGKEDCFFSVNTFSGWRTTPLLKRLNACYVDLDWGRPLRSSDHQAILSFIEEAELPAPNLVIETGRGAHLYWLLEPTPARALPVWQAIEDRLIDTLRPLKADPAVRDCTRMLRLAGSLNGKNEAFVKGYQRSAERWTIDALAHAVLGSIPELASAKAVKRSPRPCAGRSLGPHRWLAVLNDLVRIGRDWKKIPSGHRDQWLFLCAVSVSWFASPDSIEAEVAALAQQYTSLKDAEIKKAVHCALARARKAERGEKGFWRGTACDPRYRFKRETLHRLMAPLIRGETAQTLRALITEEQALARKAERDAARWEGGYTKSGFRKENRARVEAAGQLRATGLSIAAIAAKLAVSCSSVKRWLGTSSMRSATATPKMNIIALAASAPAKRIEFDMMSRIKALLAQRSATASCIPGPRPAAPCRVQRFSIEGTVEGILQREALSKTRKFDQAENDSPFLLRRGAARTGPS